MAEPVKKIPVRIKMNKPPDGEEKPGPRPPLNQPPGPGPQPGQQPRGAPPADPHFQASKLPPQPVIRHVWTKDDTYAGLAQKYYGSSQEPYWRLIYEHNKHIIGDHPNAIRVGLEIVIPPLPPELKTK